MPRTRRPSRASPLRCARRPTDSRLSRPIRLFTKSTLRSNGLIRPDELLPQTAYQIVHDETMLDGNARLNLATFVTTWMDEYANRLYQETYDKNMIDKDEYPSTAAVEDRCLRILANL